MATWTKASSKSKAAATGPPEDDRYIRHRQIPGHQKQVPRYARDDNKNWVEDIGRPWVSKRLTVDALAAWYIFRGGRIMRNSVGWVAVACCVLILGRAVMTTPAAEQNKLAQQASGQKTTLPSTAEISDAVMKELSPLLDELQATANAHDTDRFMALYSKGEGLVAVFNGEEIRGWDNLYAQQLKWWNHGKSDVVYTERGTPEILVLGPDAAVVTLIEESTRTGADGTPAKNQFAISMVWKKHSHDGWKMVYSHESTVH